MKTLNEVKSKTKKAIETRVDLNSIKMRIKSVILRIEDSKTLKSLEDRLLG